MKNKRLLNIPQLNAILTALLTHAHGASRDASAVVQRAISPANFGTGCWAVLGIFLPQKILAIMWMPKRSLDLDKSQK